MRLKSFKKKLLLIRPKGALGGVLTWSQKVAKALMHEGFDIKIYKCNDSVSPLIFSNASDLIRHIRGEPHDYNAVLYFGSLALIGSFIDKIIGKPIIVFVSGHPYYEYHKALVKKDPKLKVGTAISLSQLKMMTLIDHVDLWVCHTRTVCDDELKLNNFNKRYAILRQFILNEEIEEYSEVLKGTQEIVTLSKNQGSKDVTISTYLSYADLPGLKREELLRIFKIINKRTQKRVKFTIIDPRLRKVELINDNIVVIGRLPRSTYLKALAISDLFVEITIDEELRLTALDAASLGVPIAKLIAPRFLGREDYSKDEVLISTNLREFISNIVEYINRIEYYKPLYSKGVYSFIIRKRKWDAVREPFISLLMVLLEYY